MAIRRINAHVAAKPTEGRQAARVSCREAALRRREERKRKREREERGAAEKAEADRVAAEEAPAGKGGAKEAVVSEGQTAQLLKERSGGVKEKTGMTEVKEEGGTEGALVAAAPLASKAPNGDDVSASALHDSSRLVATLSEVPARVALLHLAVYSWLHALVHSFSSEAWVHCELLQESMPGSQRCHMEVPCAGCTYGGGRWCRWSWRTRDRSTTHNPTGCSARRCS